MENTQFYQLAEQIYDHCGINYKKYHSVLDPKVNARLKELGLTERDYCDLLKKDTNEWDLLIERITVNETFFFREESLLDELKKAILPRFRDCSPAKPLRIWCAACSTGEEPYTLGMLVEESGLFAPGAVKILGTDINKKVLAKAENGFYCNKSFSFRKMPDNSMERFFTKVDEGFRVKDSIRKMAEFRYMNLLDKNLVNKMEKMDVILCRNVLIYFDSKTIQAIVDNFSEILKPNGFLLLGHSESLLHYKHPLETIYTEHNFYYKKV